MDLVPFAYVRDKVAYVENRVILVPLAYLRNKLHLLPLAYLSNKDV